MNVICFCRWCVPDLEVHRLQRAWRHTIGGGDTMLVHATCCARHSGLTAALACLALAACAEAAPAGPRPGGSTPEESPALFAAAVRHFEARTEARLRVDP